MGIAIPHSCLKRVAREPAAGGATPGREERDKRQEDEWEAIVIAIEYSVEQPGEGIVVVGPDEANPSVCQ